MKAAIQAIDVEGVPTRGSEIVAVNFDARTLRVTVDFPKCSGRPLLYVDFEFPRGFRVLDEGDLIEFWEGDRTGQSVLYKVARGGWFDLESGRRGFLTQHTASEHVAEYLVVGDDACISVIAIADPIIHICT